jgi:hypothetical protein
MPRFLSWLLVVLLLAVFGAVVAWALRDRTRRGQGMPPYSVYGEGRQGLEASADLLRIYGWTPVALTRPPQPGRYPGLLVVAEPDPDGLLGTRTGALRDDEPNGEVKGVLRWVEEGNTLLLCGTHQTALHQALHLVVTSDETGEGTPTAVALAEAGGYTEGIERLSVANRATLSAPGALPLWWVREQPGAVVLRRGSGRVVVVADPSLLTRRGLLRDDNLRFLVNVAELHAEDGKVFFDEYHHGIRSGGGFWGYLGHYGHYGFFLPLAVAVGAGVWRAAVRLGPAVPRPQPLTVDAVDYASALARIYQQAGARRLVGRALVRGFLRALTRHLRLRGNALPAEILAAWRQHDPGPTMTRLQGLLRAVVGLRKGEVADRELLTWARAFDQFEAEVLHAR